MKRHMDEHDMNHPAHEKSPSDAPEMETAEAVYPSPTGTFSLRQAGYYAKKDKLPPDAGQASTADSPLPENKPPAK